MPDVKPATEPKERIYGNAYLVDVGTEEEFSAVTERGAINIPVDFILAHRNEFKSKKNIIVFCQSGS